MNSQYALSQLSLLAQLYLKKIDSSLGKPSPNNANKSSLDLFSTSTRSEFSPDQSSLSKAHDNQNNAKMPDQTLWDNKCYPEALDKTELKSFQCEQPVSKKNQSIGESAYGSLSPNNYNKTEVSYLQKNDGLPNDTGILFGSPEIKKRKIKDSFLEETVSTGTKNDTMNTELLFGNDTISSAHMVNIKKKILLESQPISKQYQVKEKVNNKDILLSSFESSMNNTAMNSRKSNNPKLVDKSEFRKLEPLFQKPKKLQQIVLNVENKIDESIFNKSVQCIDDTIVSQNCKLDAIEKSVMLDEKFKLNSSYKTRKIFNLNSHLIKEFYKVMPSQNWNSSIENMPEMIEPSLEYIEYKLQPRVIITFGTAKEDAEIAFGDCSEIDESTQELEESFSNPKGIVCSTPIKNLFPTQNELLKKQKSSPVIQEVITKENSKINVTSETSALLFETSKSEALESSKIDSNINIERFSLARCVVIAEENGLNSPNNEVQQRDDDDFQLISQFARPLGPEIEHQELSDPRRVCIKNQIEKLIYSLLQSLVKQKPMIIKVKTKTCWNNCTMKNEILSQREDNQKFKTISLTNKNSEHHFTVVIHILCEIYKLLSQNSTCTKRELYYRDVELLRNMSTVERALNDISMLLNVQQWELGVLSSSKGLIAGNLRIIKVNNVLDFSNAPGSVPHDLSDIIRFETNANYILVVEKDTVFQRLVDDKVFQKIDASIILITAKGYPDINTRLLLRKMTLMLQIPIYILVDADPHGIEIMCTYKYGSLAMSHNSENLAVPSMVWLGILPSEIDSLDITTIPMNNPDAKKATEMLKRPYMNPMLKSELQILLNRQVKAEIEGIYHFSSNYMINEYIPNKIRATESLTAIQLVP